MKDETAALDHTISELEYKRIRELELLKEQLNITLENLKPINLIKSTFKEASSSPEIKGNLVANAVGIGTGFLFKRLWVGGSHSTIKRLSGTIIQFALANVLTKYADGIKTAGENLLNRFVRHRNESNKEFHLNDNDIPA